ncbi:hypothetical protein [Vulcanisaeta distributa]|uniref:Uncharacterized protein n=1 Tax=Vulcanisaeta distributa (strain DSM 14429 / JCM 11212 / NBRC 100878 / IC-017) TaxID=572478 RepID=E1QV27_VULDI|nr:hypothetical protein [Vulcanisaeta distributa]ADN51218.1 conserved hypothetical protein [Vulcanisaeta distributa DSM 14429]
MPNDELLKELKNIQISLRGLAARAVINYILTELNEINSVTEDELNAILRNALNLVEIEESDIRRVREFIEKMIYQ